jgi:hypothetical protein
MGIGVFIFLMLIPFPLTAQNVRNNLRWSFEGSILYFPEDNGNAGDPGPILPSFGVALALPVNKYLWLEFTEDLYFTNYMYNYTLDRAIPAAWENRSAFVFGFLTGMQAVGWFSLGKNADFRVFGGPAADFRVITLASNLHPDDFSGNPETDAQIQTDLVSEYLWSKARWFMPTAGIGFDFVVNERFLAGVDARVWFPIYRLITSENMPPIEGWRFSLGLRVRARAVAGLPPPSQPGSDMPAGHVTDDSGAADVSETESSPD